MVSFNYAKSAATADRLIKKFGQTGAIRRTVMGGDPWDPEPVETDYPCTFVVTEFSLRERESTLIEMNDKRVLVSVEGLNLPALPDDPKSENVITVADKVVVDATAYEIKRVDPLKPGPVVVMFDCQVGF